MLLHNCNIILNTLIHVVSISTKTVESHIHQLTNIVADNFVVAFDENFIKIYLENFMGNDDTNQVAVVMPKFLYILILLLNEP